MAHWRLAHQAPRALHRAACTRDVGLELFVADLPGLGVRPSLSGSCSPKRWWSPPVSPPTAAVKRSGSTSATPRTARSGPRSCSRRRLATGRGTAGHLRCPRRLERSNQCGDARRWPPGTTPFQQQGPCPDVDLEQVHCASARPQLEGRRRLNDVLTRGRLAADPRATAGSAGPIARDQHWGTGAWTVARSAGRDLARAACTQPLREWQD